MVASSDMKPPPSEPGKRKPMGVRKKGEPVGEIAKGNFPPSGGSRLKWLAERKVKYGNH